MITNSIVNIARLSIKRGAFFFTRIDFSLETCHTRPKTKYQISLNVNVKFNVMNNDEDFMISISSGGDYLVNESYSTTLNNEKKLIDDLVENISEKIVKKISLKLDDI